MANYFVFVIEFFTVLIFVLATILNECLDLG